MGPNNCLPSGTCTNPSPTMRSTLIPANSTPPSSTLPAHTGTTPDMALSRVLLPAPLAPTTVTISLSAARRSTPCSTSMPS